MSATTKVPSKNKPILIGVGVVILILIAVYFFIGRSEDTISTAPAPVVTESEQVMTPEQVVVPVETLAPPLVTLGPAPAVVPDETLAPAPAVVPVVTLAPPLVGPSVTGPSVTGPALPAVAVPAPASVPATNAVVMAGWTIEENIDYPDGTDLFHYHATSNPKASEAVCLDKCKTTPNCKLVTFNKSKTLCWGKSDIKTKVPNTDRINYFKV